MQIVIIIAILILLYFLLQSKKGLEAYDDKDPSIYASSPSYEPAWLYNNWSMFDPLKYKFGHRYYPAYGLHPYMYMYHPYYDWGYKRWW